MRHELKTDPDHFEELWADRKTSELRFNDRNFQTGDAITLRETQFSSAEMKNGKTLGYTGRAIHTVITHILTELSPGLKAGYVILSFARPMKVEPIAE